MYAGKNRNWGSIKPPPGTLIDWGHPLSYGLIGCWLLNEVGSGRIIDSTGRHPPGSLVNAPTWDRGMFGPAMQFSNASNTYINIGNSIPLRGLGQFSISCWAYPTSTTANRAFISEWEGCTSANGSTFTWGMNQNGANAVQFYVDNQATGCGSGGSGQWNSVTVQNVWQHLVVTFDGTLGVGSKSQLYRNGVQQVKANDSINVTTTGTFTTNPLTIGTLDGISPKWPFDGKLDNYQMWNRVISQAEARKLYTAPFDFFRPFGSVGIGQVGVNIFPDMWHPKIETPYPEKLEVVGY